MFASKTSSLIEYIMGLILLEQSQYQSALTKFQHAVQLTKADASYAKDPTYISKPINRTLAIYHLAVGRTHAVMEKQDLAKIEYEIAISYDTEYGPTYIGLGNIDYTEQRCIEALSWYDLAVTKAPENASSWYARGNANYCLGDYETSISDYQQALDVAKPNDKSLPLYHLVLGITLCKLELDEQGLKALSYSSEISEPGSSFYTSAESEIKNCQAVSTEKIESPIAPVETVDPTAPSPETPTAKPSRTPTPRSKATRLPSTPSPTVTLTFPFPGPTSTPFFRRPGNKPPPSPLPTSFPTSFPTPFPTPFPTRLPNKPTSFPTPEPTQAPTEPPPTSEPTSIPLPESTETPEDSLP